MKNSFQVSTFLRRTLPLLAVMVLPGLAQAHPGLPGHTHGFENGLAHPLAGLDHILAMVAVGVWAAPRGGRALWAVPLAFVSVMALGGMLGMAGGALPFAETGIAASVLILGIFIAASVRLALPASVIIVGLFALFHGFAHGTAVSATDSGLAFGTGFLLATAILHLGGISLGLAARQTASRQLIRYMGGVIAVCGLYLCFSA
jgi:urease accessory protein